MTRHPSRKVMNFRHLLSCDTIVPSVSSSLGRNNARNFEAELEEQENLGIITDRPWTELNTYLSQASEIKLIEADLIYV